MKKYKMLLIVGALIYFVLNIFIFYNNIASKETVNTIYKSLYIVISSSLAVIVSIFLIYIYKKNKLTPEKFFLIIACTFGLIYLFATPVFKGHDELYHWYKSYAVSLRHFVPVQSPDGIIGDVLPKEVDTVFAVSGNFVDMKYKNSVKAYLYATASPFISGEKDDLFVNNQPTAVYPFVQMLPQATGIFIARHIGLNIYEQAVFGRLGNLIFYILMGYFAIKILPNKQYFLVALLLCPKVMYISATMSGDVFTNSIIILFISYVFYLIHNKKMLTKKDWIFLTVLIPLVAICKIVYLPICGLVLLLPKECFKSRKNKIMFITAMIALALIVSTCWLAISSGFLSEFNPMSKDQTSYVLHNPINYATIMIKETFNHFIEWSLDVVGGFMEWGVNLKQSELISLFVYIILLISLLVKEKKIELTRLQKIMLGVILLAVVALVETALYIQWTPQFNGIGGQDIIGVQGRYFTPIMILIALCIPIKYLSSKIKIDERVVYVAILIWQVPTLLNIVVRNLC